MSKKNYAGLTHFSDYSITWLSAPKKQLKEKVLLHTSSTLKELIHNRLNLHALKHAHMLIDLIELSLQEHDEPIETKEKTLMMLRIKLHQKMKIFIIHCAINI